MSRFERNTLSTSFAVLTLILTVSSISFGQGHVDSRFANIKIKNFGQMDERFYRGAQPKEQDYKDLAGLGIKTVVDLRDDPESYEKREVEALGMRYINIPMSDTTYPERAQVDQFLKLIDDPASGKLYVHCAGDLILFTTVASTPHVTAPALSGRFIASIMTAGITTRSMRR